MRTREKKVYVPHDAADCEKSKARYFLDNEFNVYLDSTPYPFLVNKVNKITDENVPFTKRTKYVKHDAFKETYLPFTGTYIGNTKKLVCTGATLENYSQIGVPAIPEMSDWTAFNQRAFDAMKPDLETDLNLTTSLIELVELKQLFSAFSVRHSKSVLRRLAEGHLSYSFGLKPLLSDVRGIYDVFMSYNTRIHSLMARRGIPQVRHYTEGAVSDDQEDEFYDGGYLRSYYTSEITRRLVATMRFTYDCPDIEGLAHMDALRDMLGLRFGLKQIWEAIPFSFVVDWFLKVGDWIDRYEKPLIEPEVTVTDYCISEKIQFQTRHWWHFISDNSNVEHTDYIASGTRYMRKRTTPNCGNTFLEKGNFGLNQLALSASLFTVMTRK